MIELECPWCQEPAHLDLAALTETAASRCEACRVEVEFAGPEPIQTLSLAA